MEKVENRWLNIPIPKLIHSEQSLLNLHYRSAMLLPTCCRSVNVNLCEKACGNLENVRVNDLNW